MPEAEARGLIAQFLQRFTGGTAARWWWEHFTEPTTAVHFPDGCGFRQISALVPDAHERVWFVVEDSQQPYFPVYGATPLAAQQIIGECYAFEYYLIPKDLRWPICENHHDVMIALGEPRERLANTGAEPSAAVDAGLSR